MEEGKGFFEKKNVHITVVSTDNRKDLKKMVDDNQFTFPVLADENMEALQAYDVYYHKKDDPYDDEGSHGEPAHFLIDENGRLLYQQRQTTALGRPDATDLRKIVLYINKNLHTG